MSERLSLKQRTVMKSAYLMGRVYCTGRQVLSVRALTKRGLLAYNGNGYVLTENGLTALRAFGGDKLVVWKHTQDDRTRKI